MQVGVARSGRHGRQRRRAPDGSRSPSHRVEPHAGEGEAAGRRRRQARRLAGRARAASEAVITMLTDGAAIEAVYNGPSGLLSGDVKGKLFIEMSTVAPKVETDLAPKVRAKGAALVECPVGGSTAPARKGQLLGLMGAEPADAARARPILEQLCRKVEHCGPVGTGAAMKLAINLPLMVAWQAYGEAFAIARSVGWQPKRLLDLFVESNGANKALAHARRHDRRHVRGPRSRADHLQHRQWREGPAHHGRDRRGAGRRHARHQGGACRLRGRDPARLRRRRRRALWRTVLLGRRHARS